MNAFSYYSEALAFRGEGLPITIALKIGDQEMQAQGISTSADEISDMIRSSVKVQFEMKESGYWQ